MRALVVAAAAAALLVGAAPARAATYTVESCDNGSVSGWSHFAGGAWSTWSDGCGIAGGALGATVATAAGSAAGWTFTAPPDTEIAGFRVTRSYSLPPTRPFGTGVYELSTSGSGRGYYDWFANLAFVPAASGIGVESAAGLSGQTSLTASVSCGGGSDCTGGSGAAIYAAGIDLADDASPSIAASSGSLLAAGPLRGTRSLSFSATDRGGGVRREQLAVDGQPMTDRIVDDNGGACAAPPYGRAVPCKLAVSDTLALDTTRLADGRHSVELDLWDATGVNQTRLGPFEIEVDNVPPPVNTRAPAVAGTPRQGATLVADDGAWSGAGVTLSRRWQRLAAGGWDDIAGATAPTYVPTADDVGHGLRLRVRAENGEGLTEARSEPTAPVAALDAAPTPAPTATPSPTTTAPTATPPSRRPARPVLTAVFETSGQVAATLRWGQARRIVGTLQRRDGEPIAAAAISVTSRSRAAGAAPVPLGTITTDARGRFAYALRPGVSRTIEFTSHGAAASVAVRVIPHVVLHARRRGGVVVLTGRVPGAPSGVRARVELQARHGRVWRTFATTRMARSGGTFRYRHAGPGRWFRAVIRAEPGWPFLTGSAPPAPA